MITYILKNRLQTIVLLIAVLSLLLAPPAMVMVSADSITSTPAEVGYIDQAYGLGVKDEPTASVAQSKLWWNDGYWWGILFDQGSSSYKIYWLDWGTQSWRATNTSLDSRIDDSGKVATRFDALWDESDEYLYIASHIKLDNPSQVNDPNNWGKLSRYSYNQVTKTYSLDSGFPVSVNRDKTDSLVLDKDSQGRLWVTYISRVPNSDPLVPNQYHVYMNATTSTSNDMLWGTPFTLSTLTDGGGDVFFDDASSLIAFGSSVGVMWSNGKDGKFYFATHPASSGPTSDWSIQAIDVSPYTLIANDHIKMVTNAAGQVFTTVKTHNTEPTDPLMGVIARDTTGTFSFHRFSDVSSEDTRPSLILDESTNPNKLIMFATSNATGGVICYKEMTITTPLTSMAFPEGNCSSNNLAAPHFIKSSLYPNIDNTTTSKRNANRDTTGIVGLASEDINGSVYLHNVLGNALAVVTDTTPERNSTSTGEKVQFTLKFSHAMNAATLNASNVLVNGPGGTVAGTMTYTPATRTLSFTSTLPASDGMHYISLNANVKDAIGRSVYGTTGGPIEVLRFEMDYVETLEIFLPLVSK